MTTARESIKRIAGALQADGSVRAVWVGGSGSTPLWFFGLGFAKMALVRAWVGEDTGDPEPEVSFSIFGLTEVVQKHLTPDRVRLLGRPMRDRAEIVSAVRAYREEMLRLTPQGYRLPPMVMSDPVFSRF